MTVGELRAILAGLGDDEPVLLATTYQYDVDGDVETELLGFRRRDDIDGGLYVEIELSMMGDPDWDDDEEYDDDREEDDE